MIFMLKQDKCIINIALIEYRAERYSHTRSWWHIKILAKLGPKGSPIPTPSNYLYSFELYTKKKNF